MTGASLRVRATLAAAVVLLAAGCGGSGKRSDQIGSSDLLPGQNTTVPPDTAPGPGATPSPHAATKSAPRSGGLSASAPAAAGDDGVNLPESDQDALGSGGSYARTLLQPSHATSIKMELLEEQGATPNAAALQYVQSMLHKVTGKPVAVPAPIMIAGGAQQWSPAQINAVADRFGTQNKPSATVAVLHYVIVHGSGPSGALGQATRGDTEAIWPDQANSPSLNSERVQAAIYLHETGHLLGLVDEVLHEGRGDPSDPSHCMCHSPDKNSVMYWQLDTTGGVLSLLMGGPASVPNDFDAADYGDLAKIRAGA